jgi:hypothetical protein
MIFRHHSLRVSRFFLALAVLLPLVCPACARITPPPFLSVNFLTDNPCTGEGTSGEARPAAYLFAGSSRFSEDVCSTLGRGESRKSAVVPIPDEEASAADFIENELAMLGNSGFQIAAARRLVLQILREGNSCSAWFASVEPDAAGKFASMHFRVDRNGEQYILASHTPAGVYYFQPFVAQARQEASRGSTITLNAHGAFFETRAVTVPQAWAGVSLSGQSVRFLKVSDYLGGTLRAQITTLLHEFAHTAGLLPIDFGQRDSPMLSVRNTEEVVHHCRKQIESSSQRTLVIPLWLAQFGGQSKPN